MGLFLADMRGCGSFMYAPGQRAYFGDAQWKEMEVRR